MKKIFFFLLFFIAVFNGRHANAQLTPWSNILNFDAGDTIWKYVVSIDTVNYHHNLWQVGKPQKLIFDSAYSYPNALVTDTLYPYAPNDTSVFMVRLPAYIYATGGSPFTFGYWPYLFNFYYKLNTDSTTIAKIEFSSDTGGHWIDLHDSTPIEFQLNDTLVQTTTWANFSMNFLDDPTQSDYLFRFTFISSNDTTGKDGWMIDNMDVEYTTERVSKTENNNKVKMFPNPAFDECTVSYSGTFYSDGDIAITDVTGRLVHDYPLTGCTTKISVSDLPAGVYLCRISMNDNVVANNRLVVLR